MIRVASFLVFFTAILCAGGQSVVNYTPSTADFANPERGFYTQITGYTHNTQGWAAYQSIDQNYLAALKADNQTLTLRLYYMPEFVDGPLSQQFLDLFIEDMAIMRANGFKTLLRFAYSVESLDETNVDTLDAPLDIVLTHIAQLKPLLQVNKDVIAVLEAGFIGAYGEWATINNVVPDFIDVNGIRNMTSRKLVLDALLDALPIDRAVQIRTPYYKYAFFSWDGWSEDTEIFADPGDICPLTELSMLNEADAYNGTDNYRVGQHNDCFLASATDFGTYCSGSIDESAWLVNETRYIAMGGETCFPNSPRSDCSSIGGAADTELELYHWSYLNSGYHQDVLQSWEDDGCMDEISQKLGYRIQLNSGTFSDVVTQGCGLDIELNLENMGYAAPYNPRIMEIVMVNSTTQERFVAAIDEDPRRWFPTTEIDVVSISTLLGIPDDVPVGNYDLYLHLPDPEPSLYGNPDYSIQLANSGVWDSVTGFNDLNHTVQVTGDMCNSPVESPLFIAYGCNAGIGSSLQTTYCCDETIDLQALSTSYFGGHTIGWALSDAAVTEESDLYTATILPETGPHVLLLADCNDLPTNGFVITPFLAVDDHSFEYVFEDTLQFYWSSSMTITLDLTNAQIPYDVVYGNLIELEIVNLSSYFDENGGTSNFVVDPGIGATHSEFGVPTLPPGENTLQCNWTNNPNTTFDVTCQDATAGIGGQFIVRLSVFVPFPTVDEYCTSFGEPISLLVGSEFCCAGDFNDDGFVNVNDLLIFLGNFGCSSSCIADLDGDDEVATTDLLLFLGLVGSLCE
ncbi:MAG: hypothetical protein ACI84C_000226 [Flavobacteriales bacterium]|jgi:hypothetical protein